MPADPEAGSGGATATVTPRAGEARGVPWLELALILFVIAAGAAVFAWAHRDQGSLEQSRRSGAEIVDALEAYRAAEGTYPERLDDLVPVWLPAIEQPTWGLGRWSYSRYTPADVSSAADAADDVVYFRISVAANDSGYPVLYYDITGGRWVLNN